MSAILNTVKTLESVVNFKQNFHSLHLLILFIAQQFDNKDLVFHQTAELES